MDTQIILLTQKYRDASQGEVRYALGPKLVGEPWEVKLPTDLVMLDEHKTLAQINAAMQNDGFAG